MTENMYRGKRALVLLRVSTEEQKKKYGFKEQESEVRAKLIIPLGLQLDENKHIIKDTYTGMVFKNRPVLMQILEMAERKEFDVLIMDRLDRLGRKGLQRELYRAELRYFGVRMLTTDPNEHADDDSLMGEMIRLLHGFKAEQERNDIVRRTVNGKKERAKEGKLIPGRKPLYGYSWADPGVNEKTHLVHNPEEKVVVERIFNMLKDGNSLRYIATVFTAESILTPSKKSFNWSASTVQAIATHPFYMGMGASFRTTMDKEDGHHRKVLRPIEEQIQVPNAVPLIVSIDMFRQVQEQLEKHKNNAPRNSKNAEKALLRCGLIHCAFCGSTMNMWRHMSGKDQKYELFMYRCNKAMGVASKIKTCTCPRVGCIRADNAAWEKALEIIHKPQLVDERIEALKAPDPTARRRQQISSELAEAKRRQKNLQINLSQELEKNELEEDSVNAIKHRLKELTQMINGYESELREEEISHTKWEELQVKLDKLHKFCADMREKIDDYTYTPTYKEKRDALEFFGILVKVSGGKGKPKLEVISNPPSIVSISV